MIAWYRQRRTFLNGRHSEYASAGHTQPQMLLKRIKIAITVQECESPLNDERRDEAVNGLPHRDSLLT
jgi:hypothetical protein